MEWYLAGASVVALAIWIRGCRKRSLADCILALVLELVICGAYFFAFSMTKTSYLAAILLTPFLLTLLPFRALMSQATGKALAGAVIVLIAGAAGVEYKLVSMGNALLVIEPYRSGKTGWRFDEPRLHLKGEPFIRGIPEMIDKMVDGISGSDKAVRLTFSQQEFPGWQFRLDLRREQDGGNWYYNEKYQMEGWLCPALFKFFPRAPRHIYAMAEAKE